jgi:anti-anti-sigma factor
MSKIIERRTEGDWLILTTKVHAIENIDHYLEFGRELFDTYKMDAPKLILDLSSISFLSSMATGALGRLHRRLEHHEGELRIVTTNQDVLKTLCWAGLDELLHIYPNLPEAMLPEK